MSKKTRKPDAIQAIAQTLSKALRKKPFRKFTLNQPITVPSHVHPSCKGQIVGIGIKNKGTINIYYLLFNEGGRTWEATEEELIAWQQ